jgi:hypothetical protein
MENKVIEETAVIAVPEGVVAETEAMTAEKLIGSDELSIFRSIDQSIRARGGSNFNDVVSEVLRKIEDKRNVVFVKTEPTFERKGEKRGWKKKATHLQMDHEFLIIDDDKKEILVCLSDGTTTFRNDRAKIKRAEGIEQMDLKAEIESSVERLNPKYKKYTMKHVNILVFPSKMNVFLCRVDKEKAAIREFCIHVNYGLSSFRTRGRCHQIDAAMTIDELEAVIKEITTNKHKYSFDQDTFANAWKNLFHTMDYLPSRVLSVENAEENRDELLYALKHHPNDYDKVELDSFAAACGICPWNERWTNAAKRVAIHKYIENNF